MAIASGLLVKAQLLIDKDAGTIGDYILRLSTVNGGVPTNNVLAVAVVSGPSVADEESTVTFTFATPFSVVAGTRYALVLTRPGSPHLQWAGHNDDSCSGQAFVSQNQTEPFLDAATFDCIFTVFVSS